MSAPIAEIPPPAPRRAPNQAPRSLSTAVGLGLALGLFDSFLSVVASPQQFPELSPFWESIISIGYLTIFHFIPLLLVWRGFNWARWLMVAVCVLGIAFSFTLSDSQDSLSVLQQTINWLYAPYYFALLIFLLTPAMRRHFAGRPGETAKP